MLHIFDYEHLDGDLKYTFECCVEVYNIIDFETGPVTILNLPDGLNREFFENKVEEDLKYNSIRERFLQEKF